MPSFGILESLTIALAAPADQLQKSLADIREELELHSEQNQETNDLLHQLVDEREAAARRVPPKSTVRAAGRGQGGG